jgi:hypothetical protein
MKNRSKWMTWQPSGKDEESEVPEVPQVGFGTSGTEDFVQVQIFRAPSNPLDLLENWSMSRCVFRDRQWGGVKCLYRDYCRWTSRNDSMPALEEDFIDWLTGAGLIVDSLGMVYGLVLEEDGTRVQ